jgi:hypothetical protein
MRQVGATLLAGPGVRMTIPGSSTGTEGRGVTGERQASALAGARGAAIVLAGVLSWSIVGGLIAAIDHQLVDAPGGVLPSFTTRATLVLFTYLLELAGMVLAIRLASDDASVPPRRPTIGMLLVILALVLVAAGGSVASVWFPKQTAETIAANLPIDRLAEWAEQTTRLGVLALAAHATCVLAAFLYGAWRWWSAAQRYRRRLSSNT